MNFDLDEMRRLENAQDRIAIGEQPDVRLIAPYPMSLVFYYGEKFVVAAKREEFDTWDDFRQMVLKNPRAKFHIHNVEPIENSRLLIKYSLLRLNVVIA